MAAPYFLQTPQGLKLYVRATAGAQKEEIKGIMLGPFEQEYLRIKISSPPEDGKANTAIIRLLSRHFDIPISQIELIQGTTSRLKVFCLNSSKTLQPFFLEQLRQL